MKGKVVLLSSLTILGIYAAALVSITYGDTFDCLIKPYVVVNVSSAVEGVLETVTVDRGDRVTPGQIVATLESSVEQAAVAKFRARAGMATPIHIHEARLELSKRQHARGEGLYDKALIAVDEMDEIKTTKRLAELDLREAIENQQLAALDLQRAIAELTRRTIRSPISGVVVDRLRHPGEFADEHPILTLAQLHPLRVDVFVPAALFGQVVVGMQADVLPEAPVGGVHAARVTTVDHVIDAASGLFGVRLELSNENYRLPGGLKCQVQFQLLSARDSQASTGQSPTPSASHATLLAQRTNVTDAPLAPVSPVRSFVALSSLPEADLQSLPELSTSLPPAAVSTPAPQALASLGSTPILAPPSSILGSVKPGETASDIFLRAGVHMTQVLALREAVRSIYDIQRLRIGQAYRLELGSDGRLQRFTYDIDRQQRLAVERRYETFVGRLEAIGPERPVASPHAGAGKAGRHANVALSVSE